MPARSPGCRRISIATAGSPGASSCKRVEHYERSKTARGRLQLRTGALFGSTSFWRKSQVVAIEGERRAFPRRADSGTVLTHQFCPNCGSTVCWESEKTPELLSVAVGCFADPTFPAAVRTVWTTSKHSWLPFPATIPHHLKSPQ